MLFSFYLFQVCWYLLGSINTELMCLFSVFDAKLSQVTEVPDPTVADEQALLAMQQEQLEREAEEAEMEDDEEDDD